MRTMALIFVGLPLLSVVLSADTLGFVEQKFSDLHFEKGRWSRTMAQSCYEYIAQEDGATVDVLRYGTGNLVLFKATKGLMVTVCGDVAAFGEGFETGAPVSGRTAQK